MGALKRENPSMANKGRPLPKFGEWDVNDPASADEFSVIFSKARDERKTGISSQESESPANQYPIYKEGAFASKLNTKKWFCCVKSSPANS